nr:glycosyltransferase family 2 protein [Cytobacillus firmus]
MAFVNVEVRNVSALVSIVIPVYNAAPYLDECLKSVIDQSYQALEVIIINDGSTDQSEEIINQYVNQDSRLTLINQQNHGLGYTRNKGISLSNGTYIFFLDSDDRIPAHAIQSLVKAALKGDADYAAGKVIRFNEERKYIPIRHLEFNLYKKNETTALLNQPEMLQDSIACNKLWNKDFVKKNNLHFTEGKYYEDLAFTMKGAVLAGKIAIVNSFVYEWRVREGEDKPSITQQQMKLQNTLDRISALSSNRQWLKANQIPVKIIQEHDLKSLLDLLRLHVMKYALIDDADRERWEDVVTSFLNEIPSDTALKLPAKEKKLYDLFINKNYNELKLFSLIYTNTETTPIVFQESSRFLLKGEEKTYDVTKDFKPTVIISKIVSDDLGFEISGVLTIPKASKQAFGEIYATVRGSKDKIILTNVESQPVEESHPYLFENQKYKAWIQAKAFKNVLRGSTLDLYFRLVDYPAYRPARIRVSPGVNTPEGIKEPALSFYRTNLGNMSIEIKAKNELFGKALAKIKKMLK